MGQNDIPRGFRCGSIHSIWTTKFIVVQSYYNMAGKTPIQKHTSPVNLPELYV